MATIEVRANGVKQNETVTDQMLLAASWLGLVKQDVQVHVHLL